MTQPKVQNPFQKLSILKIIFWTSLLVGSMDIMAASVQVIIGGGSPIKMLQYIASGIFGIEAFSGGLFFALLGLIFHFLLAFIWTLLFFRLYPMIRKVIKNFILLGCMYGIFIWIIMNLVVVPISRASQAPFNLVSAITAILILIVMIGLPLSFLAGKYHKNVNHNPSG